MQKQNRFLCIHAHFYQPPRENPWLEEIEVQDSAYPYHDWNERVTAECYATNLAARIQDSSNRITRIVNNYAQISFNFGPTLLSWAQTHASDVYEGVIEADRLSAKRFSGHGSAIAQAYNHMILPLANRRDKETQVKWGIADFENRFSRRPEAMWLPETAVDLETLEVLAAEGVSYTILAPRQAKAVRSVGTEAWTDVTGAKIDPSRAYVCPLPSGRKINLFFYDGPVSQAVAFEKLLNDGEKFAARLTGGFSDSRTWPQLMHIATDGETYGHHHRYGEMALAYALDYVESNNLARVTNYGEFLELSPPIHEVQILENTSWSCVHGVERWRSNCGCNSGRSGWNQEWRLPLRSALDWLRDRAATIFEELGANLLKDPWEARNQYIGLVLDGSDAARQDFGIRHFKRSLTPSEQVDVWMLMEMQRHAMLMYTSCGWFFDELSGIETVQVIQYAARVVQLAELLQGNGIEASFLEKLRAAKSNVQEQGDGEKIYLNTVKPTIVDLEKVAAHYAISSLFAPYGPQTRIFCYGVERLDYQTRETGKLRMALGKANFTSSVTRRSELMTFWAIHFGDHNIAAGVRVFDSKSAYDALVEDILDSFSRIEIPEVVRLLDRGFGVRTYSLRSLFRDEQRRILHLITSSSLAEAENAYLHLYENHAALMRFISSLGTAMPDEFRTAIEFALNSLLRQAFARDELDAGRIQGLLHDAHGYRISLDQTTLEFALRRTLERLSNRLAADNTSLSALEQLRNGLVISKTMPFVVNLRAVQNRIYDIYTRHYTRYLKKALKGDKDAQLWLASFRSVADLLSIYIKEPRT
jgi:alpha-amylase/alpha-mannosidase (GH57 family)